MSAKWIVSARLRTPWYGGSVVVMAEDFLSGFIGNAPRARIIRTFVFAQSEPLTRAQIAKRTGVSPSAVEREIRALEKLDIVKKTRGLPAPKKAWKVRPLKKKVKGTQADIVWVLNQNFKYFRALSMFVHEVSPVRYNRILDAVKRAGKTTVVIISGSFMGDPTRPADLLIAGDGLNESRLELAVRSLEPHFGREIRFATFSTPEFKYRLTVQDRLFRETLDYPHLVLLDKQKLL